MNLLALLRLATLGWLAAGSAFCAHADEVLAAVAANFAGPAAQIAQDFKAKTGHDVKLSIGATGKFYGQIVAGAPFEVLLSADDETPRRLAAEGHAVPGSAFTYAIGQLVLWSPRAGLVDDQGAVLAHPEKFDKLAVANPRLAPYGLAATEVLKARGLTEAVASKLVTGENIAQAFQFVATGNAEIGFVALSQVRAPGKPATGSFWRVPASLYTPIQQDAVLLKAGGGKKAAAEFLAYLKGAAAQAMIQAHGYGLPQP